MSGPKWSDEGAGFGPAQWSSNALHPRVDVLTRDTEVLVHIELPGVAEDDIRLSVHDGALTVSGEKRPHNRQEWDQSFHLTERAFGTFRRTVSLPKGIDEDAAEAHFEDGLLSIRFPRTTPPDGKPIAIKKRAE